MAPVLKPFSAGMDPVSLQFVFILQREDVLFSSQQQPKLWKQRKQRPLLFDRCLIVEEHNRPPDSNVIDFRKNLCWPRWRDRFPLKGTSGARRREGRISFEAQKIFFIVVFVLEPTFTSQHVSDETHRRSSSVLLCQ